MGWRFKNNIISMPLFTIRRLLKSYYNDKIVFSVLAYHRHIKEIQIVTGLK